jgi:hypothetical protein
MTYDAGRKRTLLYGGGAANGACADTWEWDGEYWRQVEDIGPPALSLHALAFDDVRCRAVLFGGLKGGALAVDGATWEWDGSNWTQVADTGPSGRHSLAMCFDNQSRRVVLFGGSTVNGSMLGDTWEWDGDEWTQVADVGPSARHAHAVCFDATRRRTVLVGGSSGAQALADTWEWDGEHWVQVANSGLDPTVGASLTSGVDGSVLFGGMSDLGGTPEIRNITLGWDGGQWRHLQNMGPSPRAFQGAAYDSDRRRVVLFGGTDTAIGVPDAARHLLGDTWELPAPSDAIEGLPDGLTMSVSPDVVTFGQPITIDFSLPTAASNPIAITLLVGSAVDWATLPPGTTQYRAAVVVVNSSIGVAPPPSSFNVEARVDEHVARRTVQVV